MSFNFCPLAVLVSRIDINITLKYSLNIYLLYIYMQYLKSFVMVKLLFLWPSDKLDAKRRRTERIRREKINSPSTNDMENRRRSRSNSQSEQIRRGRGRPKTTGLKKQEEEKGNYFMSTPLFSVLLSFSAIVFFYCCMYALFHATLSIKLTGTDRKLCDHILCIPFTVRFAQQSGSSEMYISNALWHC